MSAEGNSIMKVFDTETGQVKIVTQTSVDEVGNETTYLGMAA
jgi:hypothetical protein